ncbi:MAG: hypothetical protein CBC22_04900 [Alphaproteobacteria bacterium TMED62]|nr:MAG: hypothetical protein CBC22_04900 [Alphaproteobacteria bacterium TMED62]|tara:strand:+ start:1862 stop:2230 length:369 start_codon:yes stop_codon:yes gene_type:complete
MAETKEELVATIKEWIQSESEIKLLQKEIKLRRERKKELSDMLVSTMKDNEIDCFDINDGKIIYSQNKTRSPVSKKHLLTCLGDYFQKQGNPEAAATMAKYILDSRETKIKDNIRFKQPKGL